MNDVIKEYVYKKYKQYTDKELIIDEYDSFYTIKVNKDESPLILSKNIL